MQFFFVLFLFFFVNSALCAEDLAEFYKNLHQNPEISFEERSTAKTLAAALRAKSFTVSENIGGNGIVAVLKNGPGPTVMVRTDMDALPVEEKTNLPYKSQVKVQKDGQQVSVMHACGHDMHMTVFVGVADFLSRSRNLWSGTLLMIGQPAEEVGAGAKNMLDDGLFKRFPQPDYNLALHVHANLPSGSVGYGENYVMASVDSINIKVKGVGGHGAYPHKTKDPIVLAAKLILSLQTIASRQIDPKESVVLTVGAINGGAKHNIIPDEVLLKLTLRTYSDKVRQQTLKAISQMCEGLAAAEGLPKNLYPSIEFVDTPIPATFNNPQLVQRLLPVLQESLGKEKIVQVEPSMAGEDFSRYGLSEHKIPSVLLWLGAVEQKAFYGAQKQNKDLPSLHSALFAPAIQPTIDTGVKAMSALVMHLLPINSSDLNKNKKPAKGLHSLRQKVPVMPEFSETFDGKAEI